MHLRACFASMASAVILGAGCSSATTPPPEDTAAQSEEILIGGGGTSNNGCPPGTHLECGMMTPTGCKIRECVADNGDSPPVVTCGYMGGPCCGASPGTCTASYAKCTVGTCQPCGSLGQQTCADGGCFTSMPLNGTCVDCTNGKLTSLEAQPLSTRSVLITFSMPAAISTTVVVTNANNPNDKQIVYTAPNARSVTVAGLHPSSSYTVALTPAGGAGCSNLGMSTSFVTGTETLTFTSGDLGPSSVTGNAQLSVSSDGQWTYTGWIHESGALGEDYAFFSWLSVKDASGNPIAWLAQGDVSGTFSVGSRDDSFKQTNLDPRIAANWDAITTATFNTNLHVATDAWGAIQAGAAGIGVLLGGAIGGVFAVDCLHDGDVTLGAYRDEKGTYVSVRCTHRY